jgi:hypothetical protein
MIQSAQLIGHYRSEQRSPTNESKGRCSHMETIAVCFSIVCAVVSVITIFINLWLNR